MKLALEPLLSGLWSPEQPGSVVRPPTLLLSGSGLTWDVSAGPGSAGLHPMQCGRLHRR
jgi:hypothetical protein